MMIDGFYEPIVNDLIASKRANLKLLLKLREATTDQLDWIDEKIEKRYRDYPFIENLLDEIKLEIENERKTQNGEA